MWYGVEDEHYILWFEGSLPKTFGVVGGGRFGLGLLKFQGVLAKNRPLRAKFRLDHLPRSTGRLRRIGGWSYRTGRRLGAVGFPRFSTRDLKATRPR